MAWMTGPWELEQLFTGKGDAINVFKVVSASSCVTWQLETVPHVQLSGHGLPAHATRASTLQPALRTTVLTVLIHIPSEAGMNVLPYYIYLTSVLRSPSH